MRISDWSSDVCSSDLDRAAERSAGPGARVLVTVAFDKVTDRILADARGKTGRAYYDAVDVAEKVLVAECEADEGYRCSVADMYYGTDFYLDRKSVVKGKSGSVRVNYGGRRNIKKKKEKKTNRT